MKSSETGFVKETLKFHIQDLQTLHYILKIIGSPLQTYKPINKKHLQRCIFFVAYLFKVGIITLSSIFL